jgi:hypothetical protein
MTKIHSIPLSWNLNIIFCESTDLALPNPTYYLLSYIACINHIDGLLVMS